MGPGPVAPASEASSFVLAGMLSVAAAGFGMVTGRCSLRYRGAYTTSWPTSLLLHTLGLVSSLSAVVTVAIQLFISYTDVDAILRRSYFLMSHFHVVATAFILGFRCCWTRDARIILPQLFHFGIFLLRVHLPLYLPVVAGAYVLLGVVGCVRYPSRRFELVRTCALRGLPYVLPVLTAWFSPHARTGRRMGTLAILLGW